MVDEAEPVDDALCPECGDPLPEGLLPVCTECDNNWAHEECVPKKEPWICPACLWPRLCRLLCGLKSCDHVGDDQKENLRAPSHSPPPRDGTFDVNMDGQAFGYGNPESRLSTPSEEKQEDSSSSDNGSAASVSPRNPEDSQEYPVPGTDSEESDESDTSASVWNKLWQTRPSSDDIKIRLWQMLHTECLWGDIELWVQQDEVHAELTKLTQLIQGLWG